MAWTFLDFVDGHGVNQIKAWSDDLPPSVQVVVKAKLNERVRMLQTFDVLSDPLYTKMLSAPCDGLMEVRFKAKNVQYRPLACYGPAQREITMLFVAEERGGRFVPSEACQTASNRTPLIIADRKYVIEHDFS